MVVTVKYRGLLQSSWSMSHIFISYSKVDEEFAAVLMANLKDGGFETWMDQSGLRAGSEWSEEIDRAIRTAMAVVLIVTRDSAASEYVTYEWSYALGARVRVIPILRRQAPLHPRLGRLQNLNFQGSARPWNKLIRELESVRAELEGKRV
jgi:hypothetical protein